MVLPPWIAASIQNQSVAAIEGIYSPDGRVFGKMALTRTLRYWYQ